jgi:hypothetical protein
MPDISQQPFSQQASIGTLYLGGDRSGTPGTAVTATAAQLNGLAAAIGAASVPNRLIKGVVVPLNAVDTGGGIFAWQNPEATAIIVDSVVIDVTTPSSGACSVSVGTTSTGATTSSANLIDTQSVAAAGQLDNISNKGTNGKSSGKVAAGKWITASTASGASAGLVGNAYIFYALA